MPLTLADTYRLSSRYADDSGTVFMTGLQALARLPVEQLRTDRLRGLQTAAFISGYPGSPLSSYDSEARRAADQASDLPIVVAPAVNEEQAATAVMGSQLACLRGDRRYHGVVGVWYGKAPGVDRASDAFRHGVFAGADPQGGAVVLAGDDPAAKSSTIPSSSAGTLADIRIPVLYPGTPGEALDLGRHAVYLSRASGLWTALKIVTDVADGSGTVHLDPHRVDPVIPTLDGEPYEHRPDGRLLTPETVEVERQIHEIRHQLAIDYAALNRLNEATVQTPDAWIGIIASGITYQELREALRRLGLGADDDVAAAGIRLMRMHMPVPFSPRRAREFAQGLDELFVVEEKRPDIESLIKDALYNEPRRPLVTGKFDEHDKMLLPGHGALTADDLLAPLRRRLCDRIGHRLIPEKPKRELIQLGTSVARTPYFCSGCPHNRSTKVPDGAAVGAGIGCHTMTLLMDSDGFGDIIGMTCMGQEGAQWVGMAPFVDTPHIFQNVGDGTFFHSGQLAIQGAVAAGVDITYKLLWNRTVAMTGGQDPQGQITINSVARVLLAQGASRVVITTDDVSRYRGADVPEGVDVLPRSKLMDIQEELAAIKGVTVLIHDQQCAAEARRGRKRGTVATPRQRVFINQRICEGCGDCSQISNCLSVQPVETAFGRKTRIDQTSCNLDFSCLEGDCPSFMTVTGPSRLRRLLRRLTGRSADSSRAARRRAVPKDLPEPTPHVPEDDCSVRIIGIGGTGVVTVNQVIGTAAMFDGYEVRGLDQIGLSQKAGPVVSDLRLTRGGPPPSNRLGEGEADVLLAFDQLGAASPSGLSRADPHRTVVVGSTSQTPTGAIVSNPHLQMPEPAELESAIAAATRRDKSQWADAHRITEALFGNSVTANVFVVGMAVQAGALPLSASSVEQAIELNGVAVASNLESFRWGRAFVAAPDTVWAAVKSARSLRATLPDLDDAEADRARAVAEVIGAGDDSDGHDSGYAGAWDLQAMARELRAYQSASMTRRFLDFVETVAAADTARGDGSGRLTREAARGYFKLLAYKDEYEVARLMLDPAALAEARGFAAATGGRLAYRLHPPILRALGMKSKISVPVASKPLLRLLAGMRRLRGTPFDVFGYTSVRRTERSLPREYRQAVEDVASRMDPGRAEAYEAAVELARSAEMVRGYEHVKMAGVEQLRERLREES